MADDNFIQSLPGLAAKKTREKVIFLPEVKF